MREGGRRRGRGKEGKSEIIFQLCRDQSPPPFASAGQQANPAGSPFLGRLTCSRAHVAAGVSELTQGTPGLVLGFVELAVWGLLTPGGSQWGLGDSHSRLWVSSQETGSMQGDSPKDDLLGALRGLAATGV